MISTNTLVIDGQIIDVRIQMADLDVTVFDNVLSLDECDFLITQGKANLARSQLVKEKNVDRPDDRTSFGCFLDKIDGKEALSRLHKIDKRLAKLAGVSVKHSEPMQILRYTPGQEYKPHFDFFNGKSAEAKELRATGRQRHTTIVMYLSEVHKGGGTVFPKLGLTVLPKPGSAVMFKYPKKEKKSLHGGTPVVQGVKWAATRWFVTNKPE